MTDDGKWPFGDSAPEYGTTYLQFMPTSPEWAAAVQPVLDELKKADMTDQATDQISAETVARLEARIEYLEACEQASHEWMNRTSEQLAQLVELVRRQP